MSSYTVPREKIANVMNAKASALKKPLTLTIFASITDANLQEIGTKQVREVLRTSLAAATFAKENPLVCELFVTSSGSDRVLWH